jgi:chemotaxis protein CheX
METGTGRKGHGATGWRVREMKVEYVQPFVASAVHVIQHLLGSTPERGELGARPRIFTTQQVSIVCGIIGDVQGQVIYGMSVMAADKVASIMLGRNVVTFDQLAASAIAEMGNMISGHAATMLAREGYRVEITPPTIIRGKDVKISTLDVPALVIPMEIEKVGTMEINVSLVERSPRAIAA